jgi:hypothetical protein
MVGKKKKTRQTLLERVQTASDFWIHSRVQVLRQRLKNYSSTLVVIATDEVMKLFNCLAECQDRRLFTLDPSAEKVPESTPYGHIRQSKLVISGAVALAQIRLRDVMKCVVLPSIYEIFKAANKIFSIPGMLCKRSRQPSCESAMPERQKLWKDRGRRRRRSTPAQPTQLQFAGVVRLLRSWRRWRGRVGECRVGNSTIPREAC